MFLGSRPHPVETIHDQDEPCEDDHQVCSILTDMPDSPVSCLSIEFDNYATNPCPCAPNSTAQPLRERVLVARAVQDERFKDLKDVYSNAQMLGRIVREVCKLTPEGLILLKTAMERLQLSARAYDRILKVARTAADLAGSPDIRIEDLAEAIHYRSLDREGWAG